MPEPYVVKVASTVLRGRKLPGWFNEMERETLLNKNKYEKYNFEIYSNNSFFNIIK